MDFTMIPFESYGLTQPLSFYLTRSAFIVTVILIAVILNSIKIRRFTFLKPFRKVMVWSFALLLILSNLGFNISSIIAGLGIGGVALALGMQSTLESFFSSLTLLTDKAFTVGDTIKITGYDEGKVLKIGFRSTILETDKKTILIIPNKTLATGVIEKKK